VPGNEEPPYEVLAALAASLHRELTEAMTALEQARVDLAQARERIAELEAPAEAEPAELLQAAVGRGAGQAGAEPAIAAEAQRPQTGRAGRA